MGHQRFAISPLATKLRMRIADNPPKEDWWVRVTASAASISLFQFWYDIDKTLTKYLDIDISKYARK